MPKTTKTNCPSEEQMPEARVLERQIWANEPSREGLVIKLVSHMQQLWRATKEIERLTDKLEELYQMALSPFTQRYTNPVKMEYVEMTPMNLSTSFMFSMRCCGFEFRIHDDRVYRNPNALYEIKKRWLEEATAAFTKEFETCVARTFMDMERNSR